MKKYLIYTLIFAITLVFSNCEEQENVQFDDVNGQTLVDFSVGSANLQIEINSTGMLQVPINVTTISNSDRTFTVNVVDEATTAGAASYSFGDVTVPAGEYNGILTINGTDVNVETTPESLVLELASGSGYITGRTLSVSVFQVCPIDTSLFVGDYSVTVVSPGVFGAGTYGSSGTVVTLSVGGNDLQRQFTADYFNDGRFPRTFLLDFVCNEINAPYQDHSVGCGGNNVNLSTGPSTSGAGSYSTTDDSTFTVKLTDNVDSDCGGSPVQAEYTFTKI